jgi:hypothetical protein
MMMGFPMLYPLFASLALDFGSRGVVAVGLSPLFYIACILWVFSGVGLQSLRHWSWYTFGAAQTLTVYLNALNLVSLSESQYKVFVFASTLVIQMILHALVAHEIRVPYLFPQIKWWESGIAGMHHINAELVSGGTLGGVSQGQLLDLSTRGCFLKTPLDFKQNDVVQLNLNAYEQNLEIQGKIVWNAKSTVTHPKGIGIQFLPLERNLRRKLRVIVKNFNDKKDLERGIFIIPS